MKGDGYHGKRTSRHHTESAEKIMRIACTTRVNTEQQVSHQNCLIPNIDMPSPLNPNGVQISKPAPNGKYCGEAAIAAGLFLTRFINPAEVFNVQDSSTPFIGAIDVGAHLHSTLSEHCALLGIRGDRNHQQFYCRKNIVHFSNSCVNFAGSRGRTFNINLTAKHDFYPQPAWS